MSEYVIVCRLKEIVFPGFSRQSDTRARGMVFVPPPCSHSGPLAAAPAVMPASVPPLAVGLPPDA